MPVNGRRVGFYDAITYGAIFAVPIAPAFWFGWTVGTAVFATVYTSTSFAELAVFAALIVGVVSAFGLESVGIVSGHVVVQSLERGDKFPALVSGVILAAYVGLGIAGIVELIDVGVVMFVLAPLVYILAALRSSVKRAEDNERESKLLERESELESKQKAEDEAEAKRAEARQTRRDNRENERKLRELKITLEHERELERIRSEGELRLRRLRFRG